MIIGTWESPMQYSEYVTMEQMKAEWEIIRDRGKKVLQHLDPGKKKKKMKWSFFLSLLPC